MNAMKIVNRLTLAIYFLFFPLFWAIKQNRSRVFNRRKVKAIRDAENRHSKLDKHVHVVQNGTKFFIGTRDELHRMNVRSRKRKVRRSGITFDYRKAIIYTAK